ncbi:hypothetical protein [Rhizobium sp. NFR12]|uniref:hypothetical protein n=1 Tax=Rhizobium sp. NFR12 TaxID=1566261 RepID=UPI0008A812B1|nr:hypothetical protein [Rhizobium sp. NFR12]SEH24079.1 hypothetical protein SAMN03159407_2020 [Rhizobium sp. NFR12]
MQSDKEFMGFGEDHEPLRVIGPGKRGQYMRGIFSTQKSNEGAIRTLQPLTMDGLVAFDVHPDVVCIHAFPIKVSYMEADRYGPTGSVEHIPEFGVWTRDQRAIYYDVIRLEDQRPWMPRQTERIRNALADFNAHYNVLDEESILIQPRLRNLRIVRYHARHAKEHAIVRVRQVLQQLGPVTTIGHVTAGAGLPVLENQVFDEDGVIVHTERLAIDDAFTALMNLAAAGEVRLDMSRPNLPDATRVKVTERYLYGMGGDV